MSTRHELARIAGTRHGVVNLGHFAELGLSRGVAARLVNSGHAKRVYPGVYALGHEPVSREARWIAAVDAVGPDAVLSGRSAAALWRIERFETDRIDVIVERRHRPIPGIRVHQTRCLLPEDVATVRGIPVLRVERLLVELADEFDEGRLCAWLDEARHRGVLDRDRLRRVMERHRRRRGNARLRKALAMLDDGSAGHRSQWEEHVIGRVRTPRGLRRLICTRVTIGGRSCEPDLYFPELSLVIQIDGPDHDRPNRRREDERLDRDLAAAGITTIRIHWSDEDHGVRRANDEIRQRAKRRT
jgi:hypothetical protein